MQNLIDLGVVLVECKSAVNTDGWTYIAPFVTIQDGKAAWAALTTHYDGPGAVEKRIALATITLNRLEYRSEAGMPFKTYITRFWSRTALPNRNVTR